MGRDYWASAWLAYGAYANPPQLYLAAKLYYDVFQGPLITLSLIHHRRANGTLHGGVASRLPPELWIMLAEAVHHEAQAMLEAAVHDLTVAATCGACRTQLLSGALLRWRDHPYIASEAWTGCQGCQRKAEETIGAIYHLDVLPFLNTYGLTTEWYKYPQCYHVPDYVPGRQTEEELQRSEQRYRQRWDVRAQVLLQPHNYAVVEQLRGDEVSTSCGYDEREFSTCQVLTREELCALLGDQRLAGLYRRFFADWPMGADWKEREPQLHIRCVGESG